jgi:predicted RNA binding protein YcfA (HicA-like mRNA interferase family)/predicted RNase H-like HicB family nuclease
MPPVPRLSGRQIVRALRKAGWILKRIEGSHHVLEGPGGQIVSVPVHGAKTLPPGTNIGIVDNTGMSVAEFPHSCKEEDVERFAFTVLLEPDHEEPDRYNERVPALPGCRAYGESVDNALANAREAITGYLAVLLASGGAVPVEEHPVIATTVVIPASAFSGGNREAVAVTA